MGYSEYSIEGFDTVDFSIDGHDLTNELESHSGKYALIIIEFDEDDVEFNWWT